MQRTVSSRLDLFLHAKADLILSIAVARGADVESESLQIRQDGGDATVHEVMGRHGTRFHRVVGLPGAMNVDYRAVVAGGGQQPAADEIDIIDYRRPSRYCESDSLFATARAEFQGLSGKPLLDAIAGWVGAQLTYVPGASQPTDGAVATLAARSGVCRDYAHLVIALLRAMDVPARFVSVYAPGLTPMDFHAVAEAFVDGRWYVVDATGLAPRQSFVRIATGHDATATAFLSNYGAHVELTSMRVGAVAQELPVDDRSALVALS